MTPVNPPSNQPFCFPFPPEIKPPIKIEMNEIAVMIYCTDDSCKEVNLNKKAKIKLLTMAKIKIVKVPYNTALPRFFESSMINISLPSQAIANQPVLFVHAYSEMFTNRIRTSFLLVKIKVGKITYHDFNDKVQNKYALSERGTRI